MKHADVRTIDDMTAYMNKSTYRKIRIHEAYYRDFDIKKHTPLSLMDWFIRKEPATTFSKGGYQCCAGCYRSLMDLKKLLKFYYRDMTMKDVIFLLFEYFYNSEKRMVSDLYYCPDVRRYNFRGNSYGRRGLSISTLNNIVSTLDKDYPSVNYNKLHAEIIALSKEFLESKK